MDGRTDSAPGDGGGDAGCTPATSCETLGATCGVRPEDTCGSIDCGECRWGREDVRALDADIAVGADDAVHIVTFDRPEVLYVQPADSGFTSEVIDADMNNEGEIDMAVAGDGTVHAVWTRRAEIIHASGVAGAFSVEVVVTGLLPSLAIDGMGRPHVAYRDGDDVWVAVRDAGVWSTELIATPALGGPSAATHPDGDVRIAYVSEEVFPTEVRIATREGAAWTTSTVVADFTYRAGPQILSLHYTSDGLVRLGAERRGELVRYREEGGVFEESTPSETSGWATTVGPWDAVHSVFAGRERTVYSVDDPSSRSTLGGSSCGGRARLAIDSRGDPHIIACGGYIRPIGVYPPAVFEACDRVIDLLCPRACTCGPDPDCCYALPGGRLDACVAREDGCRSWARDDFCDDRTVVPMGIFDCEAALSADDGTCTGTEYVMPDACLATVP